MRPAGAAPCPYPCVPRAGAWWDGARAHRALLGFGLPRLGVLRATGPHEVLVPSSGWVLLLVLVLFVGRFVKQLASGCSEPRCFALGG